MRGARELLQKQKGSSYSLLTATLPHLEKINQWDIAELSVQTVLQLWDEAAGPDPTAFSSVTCDFPGASLWNHPVSCKPHRLFRVRHLQVILVVENFV